MEGDQDWVEKTIRLDNTTNNSDISPEEAFTDILPLLVITTLIIVGLLTMLVYLTLKRKKRLQELEMKKLLNAGIKNLFESQLKKQMFGKSET